MKSSLELNHVKLIRECLLEANGRAGAVSENVHIKVVDYWVNATTSEITDLGCFIQFFMNRKRNIMSIAADVYHDIGGTIRRDECFTPRSAGFMAKLAESEVSQ